MKTSQVQVGGVYKYRTVVGGEVLVVQVLNRVLGTPGSVRRVRFTIKILRSGHTLKVTSTALRERHVLVSPHHVKSLDYTLYRKAEANSELGK